MILRRRSALTRYFNGEELTSDDVSEIFITATPDVLKTFVFEELSPAQQLYVATKEADDVVDYFLDRDDICPSAQRALAERNCMRARRRLALRSDLTPDLRKEFMADPDEFVRFNLTCRSDVTTDELAQMLCDSSPVVVRGALDRCTVPNGTELAAHLLGSESEEIRKLARKFIGKPTYEEVSSGIPTIVSDLPRDEGLGL